MLKNRRVSDRIQVRFKLRNTDEYATGFIRKEMSAQTRYEVAVRAQGKRERQAREKAVISKSKEVYGASVTMLRRAAHVQDNVC